MNFKLIAVLIVFFATLINGLGQIFWKFGANQLSDLGAATPLIFMGFLFYGVGAVSFLWALKHLDLSYVYPLVALTYVWVSLMSPIFFDDAMSIIKWAGIGLIIIGVAFIGIGGDSK